MDGMIETWTDHFLLLSLFIIYCILENKASKAKIETVMYYIFNEKKRFSYLHKCYCSNKCLEMDRTIKAKKMSLDYLSKITVKYYFNTAFIWLKS